MSKWRTTSKEYKSKTVQGLELRVKGEVLLCSAFQMFLLTKTEADLESGMELNFGEVTDVRFGAKVQGQCGAEDGDKWSQREGPEGEFG